jgi:hypothetical protein
MTLSLAAAAAVGAIAGCNTSQSDGGSRSKSSAPAKEGQAKVQEAKKMEGHGEQLKAQGDEVTGTRLIEQAKVKEAEGKTQIEQRNQPTTRPQ